MERRRHHASKKGAATACATCDKPAMSGARAKSARRQHGRADRKGAHSTHSGERNDASETLRKAVQSADPASVETSADKPHAERKPTPLALAPQRMPMPYGAPPAAKPERADVADVSRQPRKRQGYLIGGVAAVLAVALFGMWRASIPGNAVVVQAANAPHRIEVPATQLAEPAKPPPPAHKLAAVKPVTSAKKPASSTPVAAKKTAIHAPGEHAGKHAADGTRKNPAEKLASASKKTPAQLQPVASREQDNIVLASKSPIAISRYAQCQELGSFLRREQCKWQVCSGKWGQDGCPSYETDSRAF